MKPACTLLPLLTASVLAPALLAQAPAHTRSASTHPRTTHSTAHGGCVEIPDLSPAIPALPAGLPCPHALYTLTSEPGIKLDYASPLEGPNLAKDLGVEPTTFSLAYVDTKVGSGPLAQPHKWYTVHYTGYLTNGTKFDSSVDRKEPIVLQIGEGQVIRGWDTGFAGMHVGGKRRLFIPYQLAYGPNGRPPTIPPKSELVFDVELIAQNDTEPKPQPKSEPAPSSAQPVTGSSPGQSTQPAHPDSTPQPATPPQPQR